jgi:putative pyruvate formate lyase activating enzyme
LTASYLSLVETGELHRRAETAKALLSPCTVCPRECRADRLADQTGACGIGSRATLSSAMPHHGEEPGLSGSRGAGTIFFGGCNLSCIFCQNYQISQGMRALPVTPDSIADAMLDLQAKGCHNIDLVSPTHVGPQVLESIAIAADRGLNIPILYNSNAYDSVEMLRLFDGIADIYLPDLKYSVEACGRELSGVTAYPETARAAIREMHRQVGTARSDDDDVVTRGLIVRLLVLPSDMAGLRDTLEFIADEIGTDTWLSIMSQYHPTHKAISHPVVGRAVSGREYADVLKWVDELGFENFWAQGHESAHLYFPDFDDDEVFEGNAPDD